MSPPMMVGMPSPGNSVTTLSTRSSPGGADVSGGLQAVFAKAEKARQDAAWARKLKQADMARQEALKMLDDTDGRPGEY